MTDDRERVERANRARRAMEEFLEPAFQAVRSAYLVRVEELASTAPWEAQKITALSNAARITAEVRSQIVGLIMDGEVAKSEMVRADRIEKLSPSKKRLLNIGPF